MLFCRKNDIRPFEDASSLVGYMHTVTPQLFVSKNKFSISAISIVAVTVYACNDHVLNFICNRNDYLH